MLPPRALATALKPLQHREIELIAAVRPAELDEVPALLRAGRDAGVRCGLWPMLADADGRWPSRANVELFAGLVRAVLDVVPGDVPTPSVAVDLEPPFGFVARWFSGLRASQRARGPSSARGVVWEECVRRFAAIVDDARARGAEVIAAAVPMAALDPEGGGAWQRAMGTPIDPVRWDHVSAMLYTSIFEGWSHGALDREDARFLLASLCARVRARFGAVGGVSLGAVSTGALGDEPVYRSPAELSDDVSLCVAAGIDDLTLFDYAGVLSRGPADAWLNAFTAPPRAVPPPRASLRARALLGAATVAGRLPVTR